MVSNSEDKVLLDCPPLPEGWKREIVPRRSGVTTNRVDVYYYSPKGSKCRSKPEMSKLLGKSVDLSSFNYRNCCFDTKESKARKKRKRVVKEQKKKRKAFVSTEKGKLLKATASTLRPDSPYSCPSCQRSFRNDIALLSHIVVHVRKSSFVCHFCDRAFYTANAVKAHLKKHVRKRPVLTSGGPEPYQEPPETVKPEVKKRLENGIPEVKVVNGVGSEGPRTDSSRPTCPVCGKSYMTKSSLSIHMLNHNKTYKCDQCAETFSNQELLDAHSKNHAGSNSNGETT